VIYLRPRLALHAAAIHLSAFWLLAGPLIVWLGGVGSAISMFAAWALYAALFTWRARRVLRYSLQGAARVVGLGVLFLPLLLLRSSWLINLCLFGISAAGYVGILLLMRVMTADEVAQLWRAITHRSRAQTVGADPE
jgi:O-antigen/teichoic acid export membrane protein